MGTRTPRVALMPGVNLSMTVLILLWVAQQVTQWVALWAALWAAMWV